MPTVSNGSKHRDGDPETVTIGQSVEVVFHPTEKGTALPRFRPTNG